MLFFRNVGLYKSQSTNESGESGEPDSCEIESLLYGLQHVWL